MDNNLKVFYLGGLLSVILNKLFKKKEYYGRGGGSGGAAIGGFLETDKVIDLTNFIQTINGDSMGKTVKDSKNFEYNPMYNNLQSAKKDSQTNSIHLMIEGLMPDHGESFKGTSKKIFYMPNDKTGHKHGQASHHTSTFNISSVFSLSTSTFESVVDGMEIDKKIVPLRSNYLKGFNDGEDSTPIETWIHWKIPTKKEEYPKLKVKKNSVIWWDYTNHHDLNLVSKNSYDTNTKNESDLLIKNDEDNNGKDYNVIVTFMDKPGTYYFLCSIGMHAKLGHKIIIEVTN